MGEWVWPAYVGVLGGVLLFGVFMVPIVAVQYRMYGRFTWRRFLGAAGLSVYGVALVAYTLLPLPDPSFCNARRVAVRSRPSHFSSWMTSSGKQPGSGSPERWPAAQRCKSCSTWSCSYRGA